MCDQPLLLTVMDGQSLEDGTTHEQALSDAAAESGEPKEDQPAHDLCFWVRNDLRSMTG
jgi:hypothetical protein